MKEYETLTREKVDVVPFGCGMPETHLMQDWSDRMLDLILNGPTINGIKKDEVRAMLRETYTALKQYEKIGPMASPFINDPTAIVARAFSELYPGVEYVAQYVPDLRDETNGTAYGLTIFPDDGSTPIVCISAEAPISAAPRAAGARAGPRRHPGGHGARRELERSVGGHIQEVQRAPRHHDPRRA